MRQAPKLSVNGLTLIELLIVVTILATLAGFAIPAYNRYIVNSKFNECSNEIAAIRLAEEDFFLTNNTYFVGDGAATISANSGSIYTPSGKALDAAATNCTYAVTAGACGSIATCYTITATGANDLLNEGTLVVNGP